MTFPGCESTGRALQQIVQATNTKPTVAVWLEQDEVLAVLFRMTVILRQKIYQRAIGFIIIWQGKVHLLRLLTEIMHTEDGVVAPCISHRQDVD